MLCSLAIAAWGCALLTAHLLISRFRDHARLRHIPGPSWAAWTDIWLIRNQLSGRLNFTLQDLNNKHGVYPSDPLTIHELHLRRLPMPVLHPLKSSRLSPA